MSYGKRGRIAYTLQAINILPLLFLAVILLWLGTHFFTKAMYREVETELSNASSNIVTMLDALYPGDYSLTIDKPAQFYKGERNLTGDCTLFDRIKSDTGLDITLFYQDTRLLTTLTDKSGARIIGTGAPEAAIADVLETGEPCFYNKTLIFHTFYFSYYAPLLNQDGSVVGMLFVGKPTAEVDASVHTSVVPLIIADILLLVLGFIITLMYTGKFVADLLQLRSFLAEVSTGNLNVNMAAALLRRNDELSEIAASAVNMQRSLRTLVEQDALTALSNRRSGDRQLRQIVGNAAVTNKNFCVAIGDIDFFKKVNDTYGHDCGDMVLQRVADTLCQHMTGNGAVARWGGEEFLLVFENKNLDEAREILERILQNIRSMECCYNGHPVRITMTFGLIPGKSSDIKELLRTADEKLYVGKNAGRNRIVI